MSWLLLSRGARTQRAVMLLVWLPMWACGGASSNAEFAPYASPDGGAANVGGMLGVGPETTGGSSKGGATLGSRTPSGGAAAAGHPSATGGASGSVGVAGAGMSDGGTSDAAAGDGGTSGAAQGDAGAAGSPPAPDDTGCVERPWSGNLGDPSEELPGLDCSSCTNGAELGYTAPDFCAAATTCGAAVELASLPKDSFLLLPSGSAQAGYCKPQACAVAGADAINLDGFTLELMINVPAGHTIIVETDDDRRVLKRDLPLIECSKASSCAAYGSKAQFAIVVKPGAPRGWARIRVDTGETCR